MSDFWIGLARGFWIGLAVGSLIGWWHLRKYHKEVKRILSREGGA